MKPQKVASLMQHAKTSPSVAWVMMNEENYGLDSIPGWVDSIIMPKDWTPPPPRARRGVKKANLLPELQEKRTLFTREQLIKMERISEKNQKDQHTDDDDPDSSKLSEVNQKEQPRNLYNQPLSTFMANNGDDPRDVKERIAGVMRQASAQGFMQTPDGRFWTEEINEAGESVLKPAVDPRLNTDDLMSQVVMETMKVNMQSVAKRAPGLLRNI